MRTHSHCALVLLAAPLCAQSVLHVPATYPQIAGAIAAAQPGDVVEVASGTYAGFLCDKGITIAAQPGAQVRVTTLVVLSPTNTEFVVPPGQLAKVSGLQFVNPGAFSPMTTEVTSGRVAFEDCSFEAPFIGILNETFGLRIRNAEVLLRNCRCTGHTSPPPLGGGGNSLPCTGLAVEQSTVVAVDCEFRGGRLLGDGGVGAGDGLQATGSSLHLVRCTVVGGPSASLSCWYPNGHGLQVFAGVGTWLVDTTIQGGSHPGCPSGGDALRNNGTVPVLLTRVTAIPGVGTQQSGAAIVGPVQPDTAVGLASPTQAAQLGAPYRIDYVATPVTLVALFLGDHFVVQAPVVTVEPTWLPPGAPFVGFLVTDAAGLASFQTAIPNVPALRYASLWIHAAAWPGPPLHAAPPIGGVLR